jgi:hypothetical protein
MVGVGTSIAYVAGMRPSQLPDLILDTAVYKLLFIAALGLIGAGALVVRYGRNRRVIEERQVPQALGASAPDIAGKPETKVPVRERVTPL